MSDVVKVLQLSDTHFLEDGQQAEGGFAYDTAEAFDAVFDLAGASAMGSDMVVVTGDVADHGRLAQYRHAAEAFARFDVPVNVCPGNHDQDAAFNASMARPSISTSRVVEAGAWMFLFVDSNAGAMTVASSGLAVDPDDYEERLHLNGTLGAREAAWIRQMCETTAAEHVFVWVHHPPAPPVPMSHDDAYAGEWAALMADLPKIKGIGAGHTHIPDVYELHGRQVFVAPSLKHCFDVENETWLPPGFRTFEFHPDGTVTADLHLADDDRWPRRPLGKALKSLFMGELTFDELNAIVARRSSAE